MTRCLGIFKLMKAGTATARFHFRAKVSLKPPDFMHWENSHLLLSQFVKPIEHLRFHVPVYLIADANRLRQLSEKRSLDDISVAVH